MSLNAMRTMMTISTMAVTMSLNAMMTIFNMAVIELEGSSHSSKKDDIEGRGLGQLHEHSFRNKKL